MRRALWILFQCVLAAGWLAAATTPAGATPLRITQALSVDADTPAFPAAGAALAVPLPDDWSKSRPHHDGSVWYRVTFDLPADTAPDQLMALYI